MTCDIQVLDEDDMASDSATAVPSQQSVKAFIEGGYANISLARVLPEGAETFRNMAERAADILYAEDFRLGSDTGDELCILRALDKAQTGGAGRTVICHPQLYYLKDRILMPNGTGLRGMGWGTILQLTSDTSFNKSLVASSDGGHDIYVGHMKLDTNRDYRDPNTHIRNIYMPGGADGTYGNMFENLWLCQTNGQNISVYGKASSDPDEMVRGRQNLFMHSFVDGAGIVGNSQVGSGWTVTGIMLNCATRHCKTNAVKSGRVSMLFCQLWDNGGGVESDEAGDYHATRYLYNRLRNSGGFYLGGSQSNAIIEGNDIEYAKYTGIRILNTNKSITIRSNKIRNCGTKISWPATEPDESLVRDSTKGFDAIGIYNTSGVPQDITIDDNECIDTRPDGQKTQEYGLWLGGSNATRVKVTGTNNLGSAAAGTHNKLGARYCSASASTGETSLRMYPGITGVSTDHVDTTEVSTPQSGAENTVKTTTIKARELHKTSVIKGFATGYISVPSGVTTVMKFYLGATARTIWTAVGTVSSDTDWWLEFEIRLVRYNQAVVKIKLCVEGQATPIIEQMFKQAVDLANDIALTITSQNTVGTTGVVTFREFLMEEVR